MTIAIMRFGAVSASRRCRTSRTGRKRPHRVLAVFALSLLASCYDIGTPVIDPRDASAVPWLMGEWNFARDGKAVVWAGDRPNQYRFRAVWKDDVHTGTLRAVTLGGGYYLLQLEQDSGDVAAIYVHYDPNRAVRGRLVDLSPAIDKLASRFGVDVVEDVDEVFWRLSGPPAQVRAFLLAHTPAHFN
jgi:hypothetical protein